MAGGDCVRASVVPRISFCLRNKWICSKMQFAGLWRAFHFRARFKRNLDSFNGTKRSIDLAPLIP